LGYDVPARGFFNSFFSGWNLEIASNIGIIVVAVLAVSTFSLAVFKFFSERKKKRVPPSAQHPSGQLLVKISDFRFHNPRMFGFPVGPQSRGYILEVNVQLEARLPMEIESSILILGSGTYFPMLYPRDVGTVQGAERDLLGPIGTTPAPT